MLPPLRRRRSCPAQQRRRQLRASRRAGRRLGRAQRLLAAKAPARLASKQPSRQQPRRGLPRQAAPGSWYLGAASGLVRAGSRMLAAAGAAC